jgi:uroporphyrinogen-III synthase
MTARRSSNPRNGAETQPNETSSVELLPLAGYTVAVTADRRQEEQVELLCRRGATTIVAPTIRTIPLVQGEGLRTAIEALTARPPEIAVLLTGIGVRALVAAAESMDGGDALLDALSDADVVTRGPKALAAALSAGLDVAWCATTERSTEIINHVTWAAQRGARIAVQRDGSDRPLVADALAGLGADVVDIPVYRWELPEDPAPARRLMDTLSNGAVDAVTFTSAPAIHNLLQLADHDGRGSDVRRDLSTRALAVCVGPVCGEAAAAAGIERCIVPERARLGAMVKAVVSAFAGRARRVELSGAAVLLQGTVAVIDGTEVRLSERERALLELLIDAGGSLVSKRQIQRQVWKAREVDEHAVEVTIARLRRRLGPAAPAIITLPRRGYRLEAGANSRPLAAG